MERKRICIWGGWYGSKNAGDNAILIVLKEEFHRLLKNPEITVFARNAPYIRTEYGVRAFSPFREIPQIIKSIWQTDILVIGGGTPFYDSFYHLMTLLFYFFWTKLFLKKIMIYSVSSQDIKTKTGKFIIAKVLNNISLITVREPDTKRIFQQLGIKKEIILTTDPAILLKPADKNHIDEILVQEGIPRETKSLVGFCPRLFLETHAQSFHKEYSQNVILNYKKILAEVADYLTQIATPIFIPLHIEGVHNDKKVIDEIMQLMKNSSKCHSIKSQYRAPEIMGLIGKLELLIGVRFHSLVFAAAATTPFIAISYGPKISGFVKVIEQSQYLCDMESLSFEDLKGKVENALSNKKMIKLALKAKVQRLQQEARTNTLQAARLCKNAYQYDKK